MNIAPITLKLISILTILFGLLICLFGYRILRLVLAVAGFIIGASFIAGVGFTLTEGKEIIIIVIASLGGGLIAAVILLFLYSAGVFLLGALFGIVIFSGTLAISNIDATPLLYIGPALFGGILALLLQKFMIILITSFTGAWITVIATLYMIKSNFNPFIPEFINNISEIETYRIVLSWIALGVLGFITQYIIFPKKIENLEGIEISKENPEDEYNKNKK